MSRQIWQAKKKRMTRSLWCLITGDRGRCGLDFDATDSRDKGNAGHMITSKVKPQLLHCQSKFFYLSFILLINDSSTCEDDLKLNKKKGQRSSLGTFIYIHQQTAVLSQVFLCFSSHWGSATDNSSLFSQLLMLNGNIRVTQTLPQSKTEPLPLSG